MHTRKNSIYIIGVAVLVLLFSCKEEPAGPQPAELAAKAGKAYYEALLNGNVERYLSGLDGMQQSSDDYRKAQADNARLFMRRQDSLYQGIKAVEVDSASFSDKDSTARVFLHLTYGDGRKERVLLPMLCRKSQWLMR